MSLNVLLSLTLAPALIFAQMNDQLVPIESDPRSIYRQVIKVDRPVVDLPTVVEVALPEDAVNVFIHELDTNSYLDYKIEYVAKNLGTPLSIAANNSSMILAGALDNLLDRNRLTYVDFIAQSPTNQTFVASLSFTAAVPISVSELELSYAAASALPLSVALYQIDDWGREILVLNRPGTESRRLNFPVRSGSAWRVDLTYSESVRLEEVSFGPVPQKSVVSGVRFLAQPGMSYSIYLFPEGNNRPTVATRESGNLNQVVAARVYGSPILDNPFFRYRDSDGDGVSDQVDNCPQHYNPDQFSSRANGNGDVCDDFDNDGVINSLDNCVNIPNPDQRDTDGDGIGDACDREESRFTEQHPWLPWAGIVLAFLVMLFLFYNVASKPLPGSEAGGSL